jgi:excisionase family DNA binding protein
MPADRPLLTLSEAAERIRVSRDTLRSWAAAGFFPPAFRMGGRRQVWRVDPDQFDDWLAEHVNHHRPTHVCDREGDRRPSGVPTILQVMRQPSTHVNVYRGATS